MGFGLYIHIPFCVRKCDYCSFYSVVGDEDLKKLFLAQLVEEAAEFSEKGYCFDTVYIGGGTPSVIDHHLLAYTVEKIFDLLNIKKPLEFTLEVNPGTISLDKLFVYRSLGVNRLSIGVQRLYNEDLQLLGRSHTSLDAIRSIELACEAGFSNISLDIIYGIPNDSAKKVERMLSFITGFPVAHISAYSLSYDKGTRLVERVKKGQLNPLPEEKEAEIYKLVQDYLESEGFVQYEVSSFAKPSHEAHHNLHYWAQGSYIGLGPAAVSTDYASMLRWTNIPNLGSYLDYSPPKRRTEKLDSSKLAIEKIFLSLRTTNGLDILKFEQRFGFDIISYIPSVIIEKGFIKRNGARIYIPKEHFFILNEIVSEIIKNI